MKYNILIIFFILIVSCSCVSADWWNDSYDYRKEIILTGHANSTKILTPIEDGFINNETGVGYIKNSTWDSIYARVSSDGLDIGRGYVEWNTSSIPDDAIITNVVFKYEGGNNYNNVDCNITQIINKPSISGNQVIYDNIGDGIIYVDEIEFPQVGFNQEINLGNNAITNLESALLSNWFAIGIILKNETKKDSFFTIVSDDYVPTATPKPTLYVEYTSASEGSDYQLLLNVTYENGMQSDFDDLRFCNETYEIDSWLESKVDDSHALVWVEFPTTPVNGATQDYYMYYGNAGAASDWNGTATFPELFVDFEDNDTSDWITEAGATIAAQTDDVYDGVYSGKHTSTGNIQEAYKTFSAINEVIIEWDAMAKHSTDGTYMLIEKTGGDFLNSVYLRFHGGDITYYDGSGYTLQSYNINQWYKFKVTVHSANDTFDIDIDGVNRGTGLGTRGSIASTVSAFSLWRNTDLSNYVDNIFAHKHATNPPTYMFGSEEYRPPTTIVNETKLIMTEILTELKSVNMGNYLVYAFILIGILFIILGIQIITNNIYRG